MEKHRTYLFSIKLKKNHSGFRGFIVLATGLHDAYDLINKTNGSEIVNYMIVDNVLVLCDGENFAFDTSERIVEIF